MKYARNNIAKSIELEMKTTQKDEKKNDRNTHQYTHEIKANQKEQMI